jgi:NAD(P)-dependent dehydrogenase (short-subunit alcohol dehydrogenase family)
MALNFDSAFFASRAAIPLLKKGENASIINYSTIAVYSGGGIGAGIYAASKGAVEVLTRALAKELGEYNIRVNAVSPGTIDTPFHAATSKEVMESWKAGIVMKRLGAPKEVATVIEFLTSEKASFLTGEVIQINGGQAFL